MVFLMCETIVGMGQQRDHYYIGAKQLRKPAAGRSQRKDYYKKILINLFYTNMFRTFVFH
jgi:hypothetical protein